MPTYKKSSDGYLLEIKEEPITTKISLESIDAIIAATQKEKAESLVRITSLEASIAHYEALRATAIGLGVVKKTITLTGGV